MYNDYSISESLFHLAKPKQPRRENSPTGQRYIHHKEHGSKVLLFVREFKSDRVGPVVQRHIPIWARRTM